MEDFSIFHVSRLKKMIPPRFFFQKMRRRKLYKSCINKFLLQNKKSKNSFKHFSHHFVFFYELFAVVSKFILFLIFYIEEVNMSIKYILVVLEMLYRIKKKIEKPSYYCEMRPKTKKWCETYDGHCNHPVQITVT